MSSKKVEEYYEEAFRLCKEIGIKYWKIDYGFRGDVQSRARITQLAREAFPELLIEHGRGSGKNFISKDGTGKGGEFAPASFQCWCGETTKQQ